MSAEPAGGISSTAPAGGGGGGGGGGSADARGGGAGSSGGGGGGSPEADRTLRRYLSAFGRFWWEFLIGDTPELFVGTLVVLGAAFGLAVVGGLVPVVVVPLSVIAVLITSVARGRAS